MTLSTIILMSETMSNGLILSLVAVCVVFSALVVLFLSYTLVGSICTGKISFPKLRRKDRKAKDGAVPDAETAAAIFLSLQLNGSGDGETQAAIATALHLYLSETVHDQESYIITIKRRK